MNNVGFLLRETHEKLCYRGKKRRLIRCIFIYFGNYSGPQLGYHIAAILFSVASFIAIIFYKIFLQTIPHERLIKQFVQRGADTNTAAPKHYSSDEICLMRYTNKHTLQRPQR